MKHRIVHVSFSFAERLKIEELEPVFTAIGDDWIRYSGLSWFLWTNKPSPHIHTLLRRHLDVQDQVLIMPFHEKDFFGFLAPWIWSWIQGKMGSQQLKFGAEADLLSMLPASEFKDE